MTTGLVEPAAGAALGVLSLVWAPQIATRVCRRIGLVRPNFRGDSTPLAGGPAVAMVAFPMWLSLAAVFPASEAAPYLLAGAAFFLLGLADDVWGGAEHRGFRGHAAALRQGRMTTGAAKAIFGGGAALAIAAIRLPHGEQATMRVVDALLIALSANAINLLDVRPGRAQAGLVLLVAPSLLAAAAPRSVGSGGLAMLPVIALLVGVARTWRVDAAGTVMMGDSGANLLGASAGLAAASLLPIGGRIAMLAVLVILNGAAERVSLGRTIAATPWMCAIDRLLGIR